MLRRRTLLALAVAATALATGCSSDGQTPACPEMKLYDVGNAQSRADAHDSIVAAAAKDCITLPAGFDDGGAAGAGGGP